MYKIIGIDKKEYGSITIEQMRQWISEGRVNAQTLAQAEGSTEWKPLGTFAEFVAAMPPPVVTSYPSTVPAMDNRKSKLVAALLGIFLGAWGVHRFYLGYTTIGVIQIVVTICTCGIGALWGFIEGICIICGASITTDAKGQPLKD